MSFLDFAGKVGENIVSNATNKMENIANDPLGAVTSLAVSPFEKFRPHVEWLKSNFYAILMAYVMGYGSLHQMWGYTMLYIIFMASMLTILIFIFLYQDDDETSDKDKLIGSFMFSIPLSLLILIPINIVREHYMFLEFINESLMFTRIIILLISILPAIYVFTQTKEIASFLIVSLIGFFIIYLGLGGFFINFMRNEKERKVISTMEEFFKVCPSSKKPCEHRLAPVLPVLDASIPDFIEQAIENMGWDGMMKAFRALEYLEQVEGFTGKLI